MGVHGPVTTQKISIWSIMKNLCLDHSAASSTLSAIEQNLVYYSVLQSVYWAFLISTCCLRINSVVRLLTQTKTILHFSRRSFFRDSTAIFPQLYSVCCHVL